MTTFKIGDRVRHKTIGEGVVVECHEGHSMCSGGRVSWRSDRWHSDHERGGVDSHYVNEPMDLTLVEPAPPPDTRKRLREYTDLCDGDVAVIAGVPFTRCAFGGGERLSYETEQGAVREVSQRDDVLSGMLVDEVRRKPRTKKRRVYEEVVDPTEVRTGDIHCFDGAENFVRRDEELKVMSCAMTRTVYRLVEETEVPR